MFHVELQLIYLEAGSGAEKRVQDDVIKYVSKEINIDLVVGGGTGNKEDYESLALEINIEGLLTLLTFQ